MALAVIIDIMKPTALAFVTPGMTQEYGRKSPLNPGGSYGVETRSRTLEEITAEGLARTG